jgi:hypothetical protein
MRDRMVPLVGEFGDVEQARRFARDPYLRFRVPVRPAVATADSRTCLRHKEL